MIVPGRTINLDMTTYYAKRIIGDESASTPSSALL